MLCILSVGFIGENLYSVTMKFNELNLQKETLTGIEVMGFETCTPVQAKVFSSSFGGKDVMVQSQTGTGKTASFLITIFERYLKSTKDNPCKALIVVPTRELAVQIKQDAVGLAKGISTIRIETFFGGVGYKQQDKALKEGVDVFIGTTGRLLDYEKMHKIDFSAMSMVVIDEADRLFDMGFYPDIRDMFKKMRRREDRQTLLFSATLTTRARNLAWDYMNNPVEIEIETETVTVKQIKQELFHVSKKDKFSLLLRVLGKEHPKNALIFTNTKSMAVEVSKRLEINGYAAHVLMGDLPQRKRLQVIDQAKQGKINFLVATDVAARGLHVEDLGLVINYDIPEDFENYVHRIGRTARAGKSGLAITLACEQFVYGLEAIENYIQMKIPVIWLDEKIYPAVLDKSAHLRFRDLVKSYNSGNGRDTRRQSQNHARRPNRGTNAAASTARHMNKPPSLKGSQQQKRKQQPILPTSLNPRAKSKQRQRRPQVPIEQLSLEGRLNYYKKKYGAELETEKHSSKSGQKSTRKRSTSRIRSANASQAKGRNKASGSVDTSQKKQQGRSRSMSTGEKWQQRVAKPQDGVQHDRTAVSVPEASPKKKKGVIARLFKR